MVRVTGFEPAASCSQSMRATNCATPGYEIKILSNYGQNCGQTEFCGEEVKRKTQRLQGLPGFQNRENGKRLVAPKACALPAALHPDINFLKACVLYYTVRKKTSAFRKL